jgi:hypothetical protein
LAKVFRTVEHDRANCVVIPDIREVANELLDVCLGLREGSNTTGRRILDDE